MSASRTRSLTPKAENPPKEKFLTFWGHLSELRIRIMISAIGITLGSIAAFLLFKYILALLFRPFESLEAYAGDKQLFINTIFEGFLTKLKISILAGIIFSFPVHLYNLVCFIFPALRRREKRIIVAGLAVSFVLIVFSFYYSYFKIVPISVSFLTSKNFIPIKVGLLLNYTKNIFYILQFLFVTLVVFQTPIVLEILLIAKVVTRKRLLKMSRFVIVIIFVLSAILTPPDFVSQVSLAVPLIILYFLTILIAKIFRFGEG